MPLRRSYALAKLLEFLDEKIYQIGSIVSGHTLKHLAAAAAGFAILRLFQTRRPIDGVVQKANLQAPGTHP